MPEVNTSIDKIQELTDDAIILLKNIIQVPSLSK